MEYRDFRVLAWVASGVVVTRSLARSPTIISEFEIVYEVIIALFSLLVTVDRVPIVAGEITLWMLYFTVFYRTIPRVAPPTYEDIVGDRLFVGLISILSVGFAALSADLFRTLTMIAVSPVADYVLPSGQLLSQLGILYVTSITVLTAFLTLRFESPFVDGSSLNQLLDQYGSSSESSDSIRTYRTADGTTGMIARAAIYGIIPVILAIFCFMIGSVTGLIAVLSPLPELLFITITIATRVSISAPVPVPPDVESQLQETLAAARRNEKSSDASLVLLLSLVISFGFVALGTSSLLRNISRLDPYRDTFPDSAAIIDLFGSRQFWTEMGWIGGSLLLFVAGMLLYWYWYRMAKRLPVLARHFERSSATSKSNLPIVAPPVARPPWSIAVPVILLMGGFIPPISASLSSGPLSLILQAAIGILWPLGLALAGLWIYYTARQSPQPARSDYYHIPIAFAFQLIPILLFLASQGELRLLQFGIILGIFPLLLYIRSDLRDQYGSLGSAIWLSVMGTLLLGASFPLFDRLHPVVVGGGVMCYLGVAFAVFEHIGGFE